MKAARLQPDSLPIEQIRRSSVFLGSMRDVLLWWGMGTVILYLVSFLLPPEWNGGIRAAYLLSGLSWCFFAYAMTRNSLRLCLPVVLLFALQLWSFFTMAHSWIVLGRPAAFGRAELWILEVLVPFFLTSCLAYIEPRARDWILKAFLISFGISCIVAFLQFWRTPGIWELGQNYYAQKDMQFWDGRPGIRAVGLTRHPYLLSFQALVCFSIVAAPLVARRPKGWDVPLLFGFSAIVIMSQSRSLYFALAILWAMVLFFIFRRDVLGGLRTALIAISIFVGLFMIAPDRLGYALGTGFSQDDSYLYRVERRWVNSDKIFSQQPLTGIGPSSILFLGEGVPDGYTKDMDLMESGYRVFLAMYGLPGMLLLIGGLAATMIVCLRVVASSRESDQRRAMGFIGMALTLIIAVNAYSSNTFDQYLIAPTAILLCGIILRTREEELEAKTAREPITLRMAGPTPPAEPMSKLRALL